MTKIVKTNETTTSTVNFRLTSTGRPTLVGTRHCSECGRQEFHTKKYDTNPIPENLNERYSLCKGICVYCYAKKRQAKTGTSMTPDQLKCKIAYYTELLAKQQIAGDTNQVTLVTK